ncbi:MAG: UDP-N-acetylmuramate dehydrogenase [Pyrinomonadaceae bacterium]
MHSECRRTAAEADKNSRGFERLSKRTEPDSTIPLKPSLNIQENISLAQFTTLAIGGRARYFVRAETEEQVFETANFANENDLKLFILGGGSNVLIADSGFDGVVLQIAIRGIKTTDPQISDFRSEIENVPESKTGDSQLIVVGAGEDWDKFVRYCVDHNLAGVECLSGIPGFVGGTPVQNVGAYGQEVAETIVEVRCFDRTSGEVITLSNSECGFSYRTSIFNSTHRERFIVLGVTFELRPGGKPKLVYKDLIEHFANQKPALSEVRDAVLKIRRSKSMVIDANDPNSKSAGSFFKNPVVSREKLKELRTLFGSIPSYEFGEMFKIPAAWLIENAGFHKGFALGEAGISSNHSLALINRGHASADEIVVLSERIKEALAAKFGIELHPEPIFIGF